MGLGLNDTTRTLVVMYSPQLFYVLCIRREDYGKKGRIDPPFPVDAPDINVATLQRERRPRSRLDK